MSADHHRVAAILALAKSFRSDTREPKACMEAMQGILGSIESETSVGRRARTSPLMRSGGEIRGTLQVGPGLTSVTMIGKCLDVGPPH